MVLNEIMRRIKSVRETEKESKADFQYIFKTLNILSVLLCTGSIPFFCSRDETKPIPLPMWAKKTKCQKNKFDIRHFCVTAMRDLIPQSLDRRSAAGTEGCTLLEKLFSYTKLTSRAPSSRFRIMHTLSRCQQRARTLGDWGAVCMQPARHVCGAGQHNSSGALISTYGCYEHSLILLRRRRPRTPPPTRCAWCNFIHFFCILSTSS